MKPELWSPTAASGTVSSRIQAFQDIQPVESPTLEAPNARRASARAPSSGITIDRSTEADSSVDEEIFSARSKLRSVKNQPVHISAPPALCLSPAEQKLSEATLASQSKDEAGDELELGSSVDSFREMTLPERRGRRPSSMSVQPASTPAPIRNRSVQALDPRRSSRHCSVKERDSSGSGHQPFPQRRRSPTMESIQPRSSPETERVDYGCATSSPVSPKLKLMPAPADSPRLKQGNIAYSPVKERAAAFERLAKPKKDIPHCKPNLSNPPRRMDGNRSWSLSTAPPSNEGTNYMERPGNVLEPSYVSSLKKHEELYHGSHAGPVQTQEQIPDAEVLASTLPHVPPIALALPQLIKSNTSRERRISESTHTAKDDDKAVPQPEVISQPLRRQRWSISNPPISIHQRRTSNSWPLKWNLFRHDKTTPAPPIQSPVRAKADPDCGEHTTNATPERVKSEVQRLLAAVKLEKADSNQPHGYRADMGDSVGVSDDVEQKVQQSPKTPPQKQGATFVGEMTTPTKEGGIIETLSPLRSYVRDITTNQESPVQLNHQHTEVYETPSVVTVSIVTTPVPSPQKSIIPRHASTRLDSAASLRTRGRSVDTRTTENAIQANGTKIDAVEKRYHISPSQSRSGVRVVVQIQSPRESPEKDGSGEVDHVVIVNRV